MYFQEKEGTVAVRFGEGEGAVTLAGVPLSLILRREWVLFISHAQLEAQNQCALLARLLGDSGVDCWYDMEAERLEVADMCRGIATSEYFLLYLTKGYVVRCLSVFAYTCRD